MGTLMRMLFLSLRSLKQAPETHLVRHSLRHFCKSRSLYTGSCGEDCYGREKKIEMETSCKVALVTGGTGGIGFGIATNILKAGAKSVVITDLNSCQGKDAVHKLNGEFGKNKAMFIKCNVTCMAQFEETFKVVLDSYKQFDIVVNCVGILDGKNWEQEIVTNIVGTIRGTLLAYRYFGKEGTGKGGLVINIAGISGVEPFPAAPTFSACQHAIVGLSRSFGDLNNMQQSGVRVVQLLVGATQTNFHKNLEKRGMSDVFGAQLKDAMSKAKKQKPEACGKAVLHIIRCATSGSVWLVEGSRLFELKIPHWTTYKKLAAQYI